VGGTRPTGAPTSESLRLLTRLAAGPNEKPLLETSAMPALSSGPRNLKGAVPWAKLTDNKGPTLSVSAPGYSGRNSAPAPTRTRMSRLSCADAPLQAGRSAIATKTNLFINAVTAAVQVGCTPVSDGNRK